MAKSAMLAAGVAGVIAASLIVPTAVAAATPTKVTIAATTATMTYGGTEPTLGYVVYGLASGDKLTKNPTCTAPPHRNVGQYAITCSGATADPKKYTISYAAAALYVGKAPLYVAANYAQQIYGDAEPAFAYTAYGLVNGDKLTATPTCAVAGAHTAAGRYALACTGADAGGNYTVRNFDNYFDVLKRQLSVGPDPKAIYFGSPEPAFTFGTMGLATGEKLVKDPTCAVAGEHVHAGEYKITCTGAEATSNYALSVLSNKYTVYANATGVVGEKATVSKNLLGQTTGATVRARLYLGYPTLSVFANQTLTYTAGETTLCTAVTDKDGYGTCKLSGTAAAALVKNGSYTVAYAGQDADIKGSSQTVEN